MGFLPEDTPLILQNQRRHNYNRLSRWYDMLSHASEAPLTAMGLDLLAIVSGEHMLEIGCGTGHALAVMQEKSSATGRVMGIDLSPAMCRRARRRLEGIGLQRHVIVVCGDALHLPLPSGGLQGVFVSFTLELFETQEIVQLLAECRRVLCPGGRLGVVSLFKSEPAGWMQRLYEWFHRHFPRWIDCRPIQAGELCRRAGFRVATRREQSMWGLPVEILLVQK